MSTAVTIDAPAPVRPMMTLDQVAQVFRCHPSTIYAMLSRGAFPQPTKFGGRLNRWDPDVIEQFIAAGCPAVGMMQTGPSSSNTMCAGRRCG